MRGRTRRAVWVGLVSGSLLMSSGFAQAAPPPPASLGNTVHLPDLPPEQPDDPPAPRWLIDARTASSTATGTDVVFGPYRSVQVNVTAAGNNVIGDAANEPSIAVDPTNPKRIVIGWRQFDSTSSNFRQAGNAYSHDGGQTWTFPGVLDPGQFRSDPVLAADADGRFFYYSLSAIDSVELFQSLDGGVTWFDPVDGFGGDKAWMTIDRTAGVGRGNLYAIWNVQFSCCIPADFTRSINGGHTFQSPIALPVPSMKWGTLDVGPDGTLYVAGVTLIGSGHLFTRSSNVKNKTETPVFDVVQSIDLGGPTRFAAGPNPGGLLGQVWVATDHSDGPTAGNVYVLASTNPLGPDPLDVMFIRSEDNGATWSAPVRVNDDPPHFAGWQWFGTMSVAPNGRIDVVWNDSRNHVDILQGNQSELFYSFSLDGGVTWSTNVQLSPVFNSFLGWPNQNKIGDYYHMISDNAGANLAYAATFNGGQDVYFLRIPNDDCNRNGVLDADEIAAGTAADCNGNGIPDGCDPDCDGSGQPDDCDVTIGGAPDCNGNLVPDVCELNFDGTDLIDACDADIDNDGVDNVSDACVYTDPSLPTQPDGRQKGETGGECEVDLIDFRLWLQECFEGRGPVVPVGAPCDQWFDTDGDFLIDLREFAEFQNWFGR